jgi:hypothetical protein
MLHSRVVLFATISFTYTLKGTSLDDVDDEIRFRERELL